MSGNEDEFVLYAFIKSRSGGQKGIMWLREIMRLILPPRSD